MNWEQRNRQNRSIAEEWLLSESGSPLSDLLIARVIMEPSMKVLRKQLWLGSIAYDRDLLVQALQRGEDRGRGLRDFRLLVAARGDLDIGYRLHLQMVFQKSQIWVLLPEANRIEKTRCLIFRMASRAGAEYERLLAQPHRCFPFRLFLAAVDNGQAVEAKRTHRESPCMLDDFSRSYLDKFDPESERGRMVLVSIMLNAKVDTAAIECWHAWIRRMATRLSVQTHRMNFWDVCARSLAHRIKQGRTAVTFTTPDEHASAGSS